MNTSIIDAVGATTKVNAPTPPLSKQAWDATVAVLREELSTRGDAWLVISGSLPELAGTGAIVDLGGVRDLARELGARVAVDTSGAALDALLADPTGIDLLTPNVDELAAAVGRPLETLGDVVVAAREVVARGVQTVLASMGADGLLAVTAERAVFARADAPYVANTAGAGDAALAGFLLGLTRARPRPRRCRRARGRRRQRGRVGGARRRARLDGRGGSAARHPGPRRDLARPLARADRRGGDSGARRHRRPQETA